jgi:hypothetical protein
MSVATVQAAVNDVRAASATVLAILEGLDPALDVPAEAAGGVVTELTGLVTAALTALQNASGEAVTPDTIAALMPNPTPLTPPTS